MLFDDYLSNMPLLHYWEGQWSKGGFDEHSLKEMYSFLESALPKNSILLETGAGNSTLMMLYLQPSKLISIAPDEQLFERISEYCEKNSISNVALEKHIEGSQWVLPGLAADNRFSEPFIDFALIDGCHGWPTCFVDLEYVFSMLKQNAYLCIDDTQLHSIKEMARFLVESDKFSLELDLHKTLIFKKLTSERHLGEWNSNQYVLRKTKSYRKSINPHGLSFFKRFKLSKRGVRRGLRHAGKLLKK